MFACIDHIGIAVDDLDATLATYERDLGLGPVHRETVADASIEIALLSIGDGDVELLAPLRPDTPISQFLSSRGPGLHHVAYRSDDIEAELARLKAAGFALIDERPRPGVRESLIAFLHPSTTGGVLTEIVQPARA